MTRPRALARPWRSERATSLRAKPSRAIAASTRAAVSERTPASPLTTRETVFRLTPAVLATSRIVGLASSPADPALSTPAPPHHDPADNVVRVTVAAP